MIDNMALDVLAAKVGALPGKFTPGHHLGSTYVYKFTREQFGALVLLLTNGKAPDVGVTQLNGSDGG